MYVCMYVSLYLKSICTIAINIKANQNQLPPPPESPKPIKFYMERYYFFVTYFHINKIKVQNKII